MESLASAATLALPIQPLFWLAIAGWVGIARLVPVIDHRWSLLLPGFTVWFTAFFAGVSLGFYSDGPGAQSLVGFGIFGVVLLLPRALLRGLQPGAFSPPGPHAA